MTGPIGSTGLTGLTGVVGSTGATGVQGYTGKIESANPYRPELSRDLEYYFNTLT